MRTEATEAERAGADEGAVRTKSAAPSERIAADEETERSGWIAWAEAAGWDGADTAQVAQADQAGRALPGEEEPCPQAARCGWADGGHLPSENGGKAYLCIDLKSFYASVECAERGFDPFTTNLVVADPERSRTTICLAVTPALKARGVRNRCRVFEIPEDIDYIMAVPRMHRYMEVSAQIYAIYLRYVSADDVHVYSIDECFIDITPYLELYGTTPRRMARTLMDAVMAETGICATAGIGTNLFLAKVALDVTAKHAPDGIGVLDEAEFRRVIWPHRPLTDIWNIGPGIARRLAKYGVHDLRGVTRMHEKTLYREFGVNAEFLIDHAWGQEPCTIAEIHAYKPKGHSLVNGQVLPDDYTAGEARMVLREMVDASTLDLVRQRLAAGRIGLHVGYARQKGARPGASGGSRAGAADDAREPEREEGARRKLLFEGEHGKRFAGGRFGEGAVHVSRKLPHPTNSFKQLVAAFLALFDETVNEDRAVRRISIGFSDLMPEGLSTPSLFADAEGEEAERKVQDAVLAVKERFGKNALLKGTSLKDKATARERNAQIGGHRA